MDCVVIDYLYPVFSVDGNHTSLPRHGNGFGRVCWLRPVELFQPDIPFDAVIANRFDELGDPPYERSEIESRLATIVSPLTRTISVRRSSEPHVGHGTPLRAGKVVPRPLKVTPVCSSRSFRSPSR